MLEFISPQQLFVLYLFSFKVALKNLLLFSMDFAGTLIKSGKSKKAYTESIGIGP